MSILKEFKDFAMKGNVLDLAIGIIIGAEFGKIVNSLVKDIIMPPIGQALNGVNFSDLFIALNGEAYESIQVAQTAGAPIFAYGNFIQSVVNFLIVAFSVFILVKAINKIRKKEQPAPEPVAPPVPEDIALLREIRDALKK
jgi:large conductance mechanosensitive channel